MSESPNFMNDPALWALTLSAATLIGDAKGRRRRDALQRLESLSRKLIGRDLPEGVVRLRDNRRPEDREAGRLIAESVALLKRSAP